MAVTSYAEVLSAARRLPLSNQIRLAEMLMHNLYNKLQEETGEASEDALLPLTGMSKIELESLSRAIVSPDYQQQLQELLEKNRAGLLSTREQSTLDALLAEVDRVALLKARALYTLKLWYKQEEE